MIGINLEIVDRLHRIRRNVKTIVITIVDHPVQIETTMEDAVRHLVRIDMAVTTTVINRMSRTEITGDVHHRNQIDAHTVVEIIHMEEGINIDLEHLIGLIKAEEGVWKGTEIEILGTPRDPLAHTLIEVHHIVRKEVDLAVGRPQQIDLVVISATMETIEQ